MARFDDWITDAAITRPALREFMADASRVGEAFLGRYVVWESSGTSGEPGVFVQDAQAMAVYDALEALRRHALRPMRRLFDPLYLSERLAFVGATGGHFASVVSVERLRHLNPWMGAAFHTLSLMRPVAELVDELNALAPTILASYPTAVALLAEQSRAGRLHIQPDEIWTGGETLTAEVRRPHRAHLRLPRARQLRRIGVPLDRLGMRGGRDARECRLGDPGAGRRSRAPGAARRRLAHDAADESRQSRAAADPLRPRRQRCASRPGRAPAARRCR